MIYRRTKILFFLLLITFGYSVELPDSIKKKLIPLTPHEQVDQMAELCWKFREKNRNLSMELGFRGIRLSEEIGYFDKLATLNNYLGAIYLHYFHQIDNAIPYVHKAIELSTELKDSTTLAYAFNNLADAYFMTGNTPLSRDYTLKSLEIFNLLNFKPGIAYGYINLGYVEREERNFKSAEKYFRDAIYLREDLNDLQGIASATMEIAINFYEADQTDSALHYYIQSFKKQQSLDNKTWMAYAQNGMGEISYSIGDYNSARNNFMKALMNNKDRDHTFGMIDNYLGLALVYSKLNQKTMAFDQLGSAIDLATKIKSGKKLLNCYDTKVEIYYNLGETPELIQSYNEYITAYDSVFTEIQYKTVAELRNFYSTKAKLNQTEVYLRDKETQTYYLALITFLFACLTLLFIYQYYTVRKLNIELNSSISTRDLLLSIISHDLKGNIGTSKYLLETLLGDYDILSKEDLKVFLISMKDSSSSTFGLLENLLKWARDSKTGLNIEPQYLELENVVDEVKNELKTQTDLKGLNVTTNIDSTLTVFSDEKVLKEVFRNLMSNSIKFTEKGGIIIISARLVTRSMVSVSIKDNGVGIPEKYLEDIFSVKNKYFKKGTSGEVSSRFGLILIKKFVQNWGGEIEMKSKPGEGTTVSFTIPSRKL